MTGHAYEQSAEIAANIGAFAGYRDARCAGVEKTVTKDNVESMLNVMKLHRDAVEDIHPSAEFNYLKTEARKTVGWSAGQGQAAWLPQRAGDRTGAHRHDRVPDGLRHTTGVEPDIALVKYKLLAGGGMLKIVKRRVPDALRHCSTTARRRSRTSSRTSRKFDTIEAVEEKGQDDCFQRIEGGAPADL